MCTQFGGGELQVFQGIKRAFDRSGLLNPGKAVPTLARRGEYRGLRAGGKPSHSDLPRF
jgi:glycolate oxidase